METREAFVERVLPCECGGRIYAGIDHIYACCARHRLKLLAALTEREREIRAEIEQAVERVRREHWTCTSNIGGDTCDAILAELRDSLSSLRDWAAVGLAELERARR